MEEKKGINPAIKIILLIIFVAVACVSSWFIGKNMAEEKIDESKIQETVNNVNNGTEESKNPVSENQTDDSTSNNQTENKIETRNVNAVEKAELMSVIKDLEYVDKSVDKIDETSQLNDDIILKVAFNKAVNGNPNFVSLETVNLYANKYFGKDVVPADIPCYWGCESIDYKYDASTKRFVLNEEHLGHGASYVFVFNKFESATLTGTTYTITVYKAFSETSDTVHMRLYPTYKDSVNSTNLLAELSEPSDLEEKFESVEVSKLNKFTYTFEKKNGNYILKSYKMI